MSFETIFALAVFFVSIVLLLAARMIADRARAELANAALFDTDEDGVPCVTLILPRDTSAYVFACDEDARRFIEAAGCHAPYTFEVKQFRVCVNYNRAAKATHAAAI
jgi:hypothetical protein